jgi:hypothetical protein
MAHIVISNKILDRYFRFLARFDNKSKKRLINKLKESLEKNDVMENETPELGSLFGAWVDDRSSDEIIKEILSARIEKREIENFE